MRFIFNSKPLEIYFCSGHYDILSDAPSPEGTIIRIGAFVWNKNKGWRRLGMEIHKSVNVRV